jgi:hypothetical protein
MLFFYIGLLAEYLEILHMYSLVRLMRLLAIAFALIVLIKTLPKLLESVTDIQLL